MAASFHRFWRSMDALFSEVRETPWGAVVTDGRFPAIWDANYARIDHATGRLSAAEVEADLLPALASAGCEWMHVLTFHPEASRSVLAELSTRGHRLDWDVVMEMERPPTDVAHSPAVRELPDSPELWDRVEASLGSFGTAASSPGGLEQLRTIERDVLAPGGKRWFGLPGDDGNIVSLAALLVMEGVGYIDNVATFPEARGRGFASAVTTRVAQEAFRHGASRASLLVDPDAPAVVRLYHRLGFRETGRLASTRGPVT